METMPARVVVPSSGSMWSLCITSLQTSGSQGTSLRSTLMTQLEYLPKQSSSLKNSLMSNRLGRTLKREQEQEVVSLDRDGFKGIQSQIPQLIRGKLIAQKVGAQQPQFMRHSQTNMDRLLAHLKIPSLPSRSTAPAPSQKTRLSTHLTWQVAPTSTVRMEYSKLRIFNSPGHRDRITSLNSSQMQLILIFPQIRRSPRNKKRHKRAHKAIYQMIQEII